ncbi:hypothetical protein [Serratia quinivorans]|uniref:hypothetical protein n=1 Tax=Serratia quinivorans TaxID=137545 RepID=UPI003F9E7BBC
MYIMLNCIIGYAPAVSSQYLSHLTCNPCQFFFSNEALLSRSLPGRFHGPGLNICGLWFHPRSRSPHSDENRSANDRRSLVTTAIPPMNNLVIGITLKLFTDTASLTTLANILAHTKIC